MLLSHFIHPNNPRRLARLSHTVRFPVLRRQVVKGEVTRPRSYGNSEGPVLISSLTSGAQLLSMTSYYLERINLAQKISFKQNILPLPQMPYYVWNHLKRYLHNRLGIKSWSGPASLLFYDEVEILPNSDFCNNFMANGN